MTSITVHAVPIHAHRVKYGGIMEIDETEKEKENPNLNGREGQTRWNEASG